METGPFEDVFPFKKWVYIAMLVLPEGAFSRGSNDFNSTSHERSEGELGTQKISPRNRPQKPFQVKRQKTHKKQIPNLTSKKSHQKHFDLMIPSIF